MTDTDTDFWENRRLTRFYPYISLSALVKFDIISIEDLISINGNYSGTLHYTSDNSIVIETKDAKFKSMLDYVGAINIETNQCYKLDNIVIGNKTIRNVAKRFIVYLKNISSLSDAMTAIGLVTVTDIDVCNNEEMQKMQTSEYWIKDYIKSINEFKYFDNDEMFQYFVAIGFEYSSAQCCESLVKRFAHVSSQNWSYWAEVFVSNMLNID